MLGNNDVRINYVVTGTDPSPIYRNAIGDECVYVQEGAGTVETVVRGADLPRPVTTCWSRGRPTTGGCPREPSRLYAIEANSHIAPPKRYLSRFGQLLEHAPYCERDLYGPTEPHVVEGTDVEVLVKHRVSNVPGGVGGSRLTYATHPFDVVGWDGCLYPHTFNVEDYMPITGKVHQPPPVHQVFEGHNFVVCNFVPRKVDYHPLAIPVPYYHSNVDSDEMMFYVGGDYEARKGSGINIGSISLHPGGHAHGPQPSAIEASLGAEQFDELAVMIDTFLPLDLGEAGLAAEDPAYAWTWAGRGPDSDARTRAPATAARRSSPTPEAQNATVGVEILTPREVPLGGLRAMTVRRTLPQRDRTLIGAWCFLDHYGPDEVERDRRHARLAAPAHRAADRELAVQRRDRPRRLRRQPRRRSFPASST